MNVLIVHAHPEPTSFTAAMKDAAWQAARTADPAALSRQHGAARTETETAAWSVAR